MLTDDESAVNLLPMISSAERNVTRGCALWSEQLGTALAAAACANGPPSYRWHRHPCEHAWSTIKKHWRQFELYGGKREGGKQQQQRGRRRRHLQPLRIRLRRMTIMACHTHDRQTDMATGHNPAANTMEWPQGTTNHTLLWWHCHRQRRVHRRG